MKKVFLVIFLLSLFYNGIQSQKSNLQNDSAKQNETKSDLLTQLDSLNYAYGLSYGDSIRSNYFKNDSTDQPLYAFIDAYDEVFGQGIVEPDEIYEKGFKVGFLLFNQNSKALMGDTTITFNQKLVEFGLIDALNGSYYFMNQQEAKQFLKAKINQPKHGRVTDIDQITNRMLNYAYGMTIGTGIKDDYFKGDSADIKTKSFIDGIKASTEKIENNFSQFSDMGTQFGVLLKKQINFGMDNDSILKVNIELIRQGLLNGLNGEWEWMTDQKAREYCKTTIQMLRDKKSRVVFISNKAAGEKFLAENAKKPGVIMTPSGLQYEILIKGNGSLPTDSSKVKLHYHGTLIDGTVFDSSVDRKAPVVFPVNQVMKGWEESLQLMSVGSKYKLYVPQELAYGSKEQGIIRPFSMLIFEVELLSIEE